MKIRTKRTKGIEYAGWKLDGWEVVLGGAILALFLSYLLPDNRTTLIYISCGLGGLWLLGVIAVFITVLADKSPPTTAEPGGGAPKAHQHAPPPKQT